MKREKKQKMKAALKRHSQKNKKQHQNKEKNMLDLKFIRDNIETVKKAAQLKNCSIAFDELLALDHERRQLLQTVEQLKNQQNKANDEMVALKKDGTDFKGKISELKTLSQKIKEIDSKVGGISDSLNKILLTIPNLPHESIPIGGEKANKVVREWGTLPTFDFEPKDHLTLTDSLGYISMETGTKICGSAFVLYKDFGAKLERALINFMLDFHTTKHSYREISPPFLVNRASMTGTGQLPKLEEDMYRLKDDDLFLIPTAEVPVTNIHRDDILKEEDLPIKYVAYTPCFRREAGSYGKDTRGLSRVHQFDKVELVKFVRPETSVNELEMLVADAEDILKALGLPYRVLLLSTGEISFAANKCYDLEVWAPGTKRWFEVSSCSNFCDFQARRANIRFRSNEDKKTYYVHTLNGSGVALARLFLCIVENFQKKDGTIQIPKILEPYLCSRL
jgi:seryl-tRNA synthetase